jgi:hypothetical protein
LQLFFFALVAAWLYQQWQTTMLVVAMLAASSAIMLIGLIRPTALRWIFVGWILAVFPIGWLVSHLLLAAVFYLLFTPVGLLMRICGYDPMQRRIDRNAESYWKPRPTKADTERYFKQY